MKKQPQKTISGKPRNEFNLQDWEKTDGKPVFRLTRSGKLVRNESSGFDYASCVKFR